ncbi:hypothetical protein EPJ67_12255 [Brachyspira aalborgi]|uniref:Lipoprotein n=1 Tax=Brachyspira aalborgi TaxID=29522 RepID=A0A5C8FZ75_9SPIR|nr:hypothetical protein [Brachyspira aalborgi]TXJ55016.1 hypothetical protein EPJ67_12255 [Brachyspira aalborgi]
MKLLKKITILLCFLSLIAFVSCSAEDKSGVKEKDNTDGTEITGGGKSGTSETDGSSGTGGSSGTSGSTGTGSGEKTFASYAGTWYGDMDGSGEKPLILINSDGSFKILGGDINVPSSDITKNSDTSYTASQGSESITFNFSSDTQGTVDFGYGKDGILTITKH